jgi:hypothetical protein
MLGGVDITAQARAHAREMLAGVGSQADTAAVEEIPRGRKKRAGVARK